jgi:two-component system response regulator
MKTILLVEDNESDAKLTVFALHRCGVESEVVVAPDGPSALDHLQGTSSDREDGKRKLPAVVLLDLNLPKIEGLEVLRRIRSSERTRLLPVVVLTSSREEADILRSYALGANAYLQKPVDFAEFADVAQVLSLFWLRLNEGPPST